LDEYYHRRYYDPAPLKIAAGCFIIAFILIILLIFVNSCSGQNLVPRSVVWEYPNLTDYPDSSIHFIVYMRAEPDTTFTVLDTTAAEAMDMDLLSKTWLYNFTWRTFYVTAIMHQEIWPDSNWTYESKPSNSVGEYFRALPPIPIDTVDGLQFRKINAGEVPAL
jgi:hypothetical protein